MPTLSKKTKNKKKEPMKEQMKEMLAKAKALPRIPKVGDIVEGKVIEIGRTMVFLDLGPIGTGVVIGKELEDGLGTFKNLKVGDKISATVLDLENEEGYVELSFREASFEKVWDDLFQKMEKGEILTTKILEANKGGLMVEINGVVGFLPVSQLTFEHYPRVEGGDKEKILGILKKYIGQYFKTKIIDLDREEEKLIVSEKQAQMNSEEKTIAQLKVGDIVEGKVSGLANFGVFVRFKFKEVELEGLVHISELAWHLVEDPKDIVKVGDKVKVKIIGIDGTRLSLSLKALQDDLWKSTVQKYKEGQKIKGEVVKITPYGAIVKIDEHIHGLVHISKFNQEQKKLENFLEVGKNYHFKILTIKSEEHKLELDLVDGNTAKESLQ